MGTSIFVTVLCMAAVGGAGYGVLKLADLVLGGRIGQRTRCRWAAVVAAAHLVPVHLLWRLVPVRVEAPTVGSGFAGHAAATVQGAVVGTGHGFAVGTGTAGTVKSAAFGRAEILGVLAAVWLAGACVCALWSLWRFLRARRALMSGGAEAGAELYDAAVDAARELGVRKSPVVRVCPGLGSPTLVGFLRPVVLMPEAELTEGQARMLFAHELTHFKRGDLWKKLLMNAVRAVQWYDPAVWLLGRDLEYWIETACDEAVAGSMEKERRREYGYLLIEFATASRPMGVPLGSGRRKLERRIKTMMKSTKKKRAIIGAALAVAVLAGCVGASAVAASYDKVELTEVEGPKPEPRRDPEGNILPEDLTPTEYLEDGTPVPRPTPPPTDADGNPLPKDTTPTEYLEDGMPVPRLSGSPELRTDPEGNILTEDLTPTEYLEDGTPVPAATVAGTSDTRDVTDGQSSVCWSDVATGHNRSVSFTGNSDDGHFRINAGETATFSVEIKYDEYDNIVVGWVNADGSLVELYKGKTKGESVTYTPDEDVAGSFYLWNQSAATIYFDARMEY